ncbi:TPA: hypothetical protein SMG11_004431 [Serratia marcescens]|jgi:hypothetical protein|nr:MULTISPECIES: hypothetical protein [Serratia]AVN49073.1 hypothetical protein AM478_04695 [Serratia marcescens]AWC70745.1 hypothetical protein AM368_11210 [Serratia marcescens]AWC88703.1 hypothetical protein AM370_06940 [Serratia marcescens]AWS59093.1 hypothetical protein AM369_12700 [Serratia marcescens]AWS70472.1 hypothetical protein AM378_19575 [Serratia marcescens]
MENKIVNKLSIDDFIIDESVSIITRKNEVINITVGGDIELSIEVKKTGETAKITKKPSEKKINFTIHKIDEMLTDGFSSNFFPIYYNDKRKYFMRIGVAKFSKAGIELFLIFASKSNEESEKGSLEGDA